MSLRDNPPILDCSDLLSPHVLWALSILMFRAMLITWPPILGPAWMGYHVGLWSLSLAWMPLAFSYAVWKWLWPLEGPARD